ncbi:MAG: packaged DNA stabilization gp4 family protein [Desulfobacterales bacterium]
MGWTKRQLIEQAFDEIGLASYVYDLTPDQLQSALRKMDGMLAGWDAKGIKIGYPLTASPQDSSLDTETNVPDAANEAIYLNLGIRIAPGFGKMVAMDTKANAREAYRALLVGIAMPKEMQLPSTMPSGAGNKSWRTDQPFLNTPDTSPIRLGDNGQLVFTE